MRRLVLTRAAINRERCTCGGGRGRPHSDRCLAVYAAVVRLGDLVHRPLGATPRELELDDMLVTCTRQAAVEWIRSGRTL